MRKPQAAPYILFFLSLVVSACDKPPAVQTISGQAQGTTYSVKYWSETPIDGTALKQSIDKELAHIDKLMSNYRDDSAIEVFNHNKVAHIPIMVDKEILDLLNIAAEVHEKSKGCYDPTIKPLFQIWGFGDDKLQIPDSKTIANAKNAIGFADKLLRSDKTITKKNMAVTIDLSAIGQGYAVARIADIVAAEGIANYLVEIGGEMLVAGTKPEAKKWRVGVERPVPDSQQISEVIRLSGKRPTAVMTSGTYRHYFDNDGKRYSHILDPRTGAPVTHNSVAVTVLLDDATYADAWSTALLCLGSREGLPVANANNIPSIFYDIDERRQIIRQNSDSVVTQHPYWQVE